jgi:hypothetical protein
MLAAPINLTVDMLKEINAGQPLQLIVRAESNTTIPLRDVLIRIEYPQGFAFREADPKPTFGNNIWKLSSMSPSQKFSLKVDGIMSGEATQEKVFHTAACVAADRTERECDAVYSNVISEVALSRPFIGLGLALNGKPASDVVVTPGESIGGSISWQNNLPSRVVDAQFEVKLKGVALDRRSISGGSCFYRSLDDTIFCDERDNPELAVLEAGENGLLSFDFTPLPLVSNSGELLTNPEMCVELTTRGRRFDESGVPEEIKTVIVQCAKVTSQAQFAARSVHYVGPFVNTGPIPPRAEKETTFTIIWTIRNTANSLTNGKVRAIIPVYVDWARQVSPVSEKITYNPNTNEVVWDVGDIPIGTGISTPPREVAFQLILTPSLSQIGQMPKLMNDIRFTAIDTFTNQEVGESRPEISTNNGSVRGCGRISGIFVSQFVKILLGWHNHG